jgi:peptidoglycan/LPS O-acetylase OafA/YrhL
MAEYFKSGSPASAEAIADSVADAPIAQSQRLHKRADAKAESSVSRGHFDSVQVMRALSVIAVVLFHVAMRQRQDFPHVALPLTYPQSLMGHAGVDLFFIISGFIITTVNWNEFARTSAIRSYIAKRFIRVLPLYWLTALPMIPLAMAQNLDFKSAIGALLLLPHYASRINQVAWSLAYEILFYAVFAVFLLFPRRFLPLCLTAWLLLIAANNAAPHMLSHFAWLGNFLRPLNLEFVLGITIAALIQARIFFRRPRLLICLGIIGILAVAALKHFGPNPYPEYDGKMRALLFGVPCALVLYGAIVIECLGKTAYSKLLLLLGDASYSIYLVHFVLIQLLMLNPIIAAVKNPAAFFLWELLVIVLVLAAGVLIHLKVEKPLLRTLKHRFVG